MTKRTRSSTVSLRISDEMRAKIDKAIAEKSFGPFKVTVTAIVERGIELALRRGS